MEYTQWEFENDIINVVLELVLILVVMEYTQWDKAMIAWAKYKDL